MSTAESKSQHRMQTPKFAQVVAADLRSQIGRGELKAGDRLPSEAALMEHFGVSRPTLREAMRILENESLIDIRLGAKGGAFVTFPDPEVVVRQAGLLLQREGTTIGDAYQARAAMEPACVRLLAEQRSASAVTTLREALDDCIAATDDVLTEAYSANRFHVRLVELTGNYTLTFLARIISSLLDASYAANAERLAKEASRARIERSLRDYREVIRLIEAGAADEAEALWVQHMRTALTNKAMWQASVTSSVAMTDGSRRA